MPSSVRFVLLLMVAALVLAIGSLATLREEDRRDTVIAAERLANGHVADGKRAFVSIGCGACHRIRGVAEADGMVGPALDGFASRAEIAGALSNTPEHLIRWLQHPQQVVPGNGMPDQQVNDRDARDVAAYLYTLTSER